MELWIKLAFFWLFCGLGYCNTSICWRTFNGSRFRVVNNRTPHRGANELCRRGGIEGHLAYPKDLNTLLKFESLPHYFETDSYWLSNENYTTTDFADLYLEPEKEFMEDLCPYLKQKNVRFEFCTTPKPFICEAAESTLSCPEGFNGFNMSCYKVMSPLANFTEAEERCERLGAKLAAVDSRRKHEDLYYAFVEDFEYLSFGTRPQESFVLVSGDYKINTNGNSSDSECTVLDLNRWPVSVESLTSVNCSSRYYFVCEVDSLNTTLDSSAITSEENATVIPTTSEPTVPTTTLTPLECPHGQNWKSHEESGFCYWETTYETERLNWYEAREFCKLYDGDLASYSNLEQETLGLGGARGHYKGLWIGLKRDEYDVFHWTDGSTLNFSNWDISEPKLRSKTKYCVMHGAGHSKWQLDYCGVRRWFICKAPKVRSRTPVSVPQKKSKACDVEDVSIYRTDWYEFEDYCYMAHSGKYTWDTANAFCQDNGGNMASIHSFRETDFILKLIGVFPDYNYWIGLGALGLHSSYNWSDNTPLDFIYWADADTEDGDDTADVELGVNTCISFNKRDGSWMKEHCNRLQSVVCKRGVNVTYNFSNIEPTVVMPGNCENGWYNYGNKCYKYFSLWSQRKTWPMAKTECKNIGASLVSIHSNEEQDLITDIVLDANTELWIGLESKESGTIYHWSDDSRMDYTNWDVGEPAYSRDSGPVFATPNNLCVVMESSQTSLGKWNDILCSSEKGYICEKMKNPTISNYQDPFLCPNMTGWYRLGSYCYGIFEDAQLTWLQAQRECRKNNEANLITYENDAVSTFIKRKLKNRDLYFWIGVRELEENSYESVTGHALFYTNWMSSQPSRASSLLDNCAATTATRGWLVKSCQERLPYICKKKLLKDEIPDNVDIAKGVDQEVVSQHRPCKGISNLNWVDYGGRNCFYVENSLRKWWTDAMHYCFQHGGFLASIHSLEENRYILEQIKRDTVHIGLGLRHDGNFAWVDNSPLDFTNWEDMDRRSELSAYMFDKHCVVMSGTTGKWLKVECSDNSRLHFVCSTPKKVTSNEETTSPRLDNETNELGHKLTVGGIFGIIICVSVILAIAGVTVYYLRTPKKEIQPSLLEPDAL